MISDSNGAIKLLKMGFKPLSGKAALQGTGK
jgi:hypothetical protein